MQEKNAAEISFPLVSSTHDELELSYSGAALLSNKFFANNTNAGVRLTFCENIGIEGSAPKFRSAVVLSYPDAIALRDLLSHQLKSIAFLEAPPEAVAKEG